MKTNTSAPAVSRALRAAGFGVVATRRREGLLVTGALGTVCVIAQIDSSERQAAFHAASAADALREVGYTVEQIGPLLNVSRG